MKIVKWIVQALVIIAFLAAGGSKLITPYDELLNNPQMSWVSLFTGWQIKMIASLEVLGALTLLIGMFVKPLSRLVPIAAAGLALTMIGAAITHLSLGEPIYANALLFILSVLTLNWRKDMLKS